MRTRSRCFARLALIATAVLAARLLAQQGEPPSPTIKVDVRQVLVPVVVTDKEGHHVPGLKQTDFKVFEDGIEQTITAFSVQSSGVPSVESAAAGPGKPAPESTRAAPNSARPRRTYVIVIDTMHTAIANFSHVRDALKKLFREEQPGDSQYVVVAIARTVEAVQDTTQDPAAVLKAIESKDFQKLLKGSQKSSLQAELDRFRQSLDEAREKCDKGDPECGMLRILLPSQANSMAASDLNLTTGFLRQFRALIELLTHTAGRRTVVLISDGFSLTPGKAALEILASYFPENRGAALRSTERMRDEFEPIVRIAAASNIPIYTIDSRGLYTMEDFDVTKAGSTSRMAPSAQLTMNDVALNAGNTLAEMAAATGGTFFHNSNDLAGSLKRAFADGREYYTLAYVSTNANLDGKFRAIRVEVRDRKAVVNAKRGYWAVGN